MCNVCAFVAMFVPTSDLLGSLAPKRGATATKKDASATRKGAKGASAKASAQPKEAAKAAEKAAEAELMEMSTTEESAGATRPRWNVLDYIQGKVPKTQEADEEQHPEQQDNDECVVKVELPNANIFKTVAGGKISLDL